MKKLKKISLVSQNAFISEKHFSCVSHQNCDAVALVITESELIKNSTSITAYDNNYQPYDRLSSTFNNMAVVTHFLTEDGYLVVDKGVIGTDTATFISKINIVEESDRFVISVTIVNDDSIADAVYTAYRTYDINVNAYLQENLMHKLRYSYTPVPVLMDRIEHTRFIDCSETNYVPIPVKLLRDGSYTLNEESTNYRLADGLRTVSVGSQLYIVYPGDVLEVIQVMDFAHSVYGDFYGMARVLTLCRHRQVQEGKRMPMRVYTKGVDINVALINLLNQAEGLLEPPPRTGIGSKVIYQELQVGMGAHGISRDVFQFTIREKPLKMGAYQPVSDEIIPAGLGDLVGTLLMSGPSMKILLYRVTGIVTYDGKHYLRFEFDSETSLFKDFAQLGMDLFMPAKHVTACRMAEYLMATGELVPYCLGAV